ncbi:MAG TPA: endonuclease/exonuclease/phosphatase family protein [Candidatus Omnitrophota bacterium]|nr:endonuclease/exonuclease/phosphatase family protein [Candidatus Omnitrophota bacterium]
MKILTLNTWQERGPWQKRWELIFQGLKEYNADVVGFQEVFNMEWAKTIRERSGYPYLAVSGQHSGLIFLSKLKLVEQECLIMTTKSPTEDYLRYAFYVQVAEDRHNIALINTHLSWKAEENDVRMKQVMELSDFVQRKAGNLPTAVMGDFNTGPYTTPMVYLREMKQWIDTYPGINLGAAGLTWDYRNPYAEAERDKMAERRIDYIFIRERTGPFERVRSSKVVFDQPSQEGIFSSDHFGVLTEFAS